MGQGWANAAGRQAPASAPKKPLEKKRRTHMEKVAQAKLGTASPNGCNEAAWGRRWPVALGTTMDHRQFFASPFTNGRTHEITAYQRLDTRRKQRIPENGQHLHCGGAQPYAIGARHIQSV